MRAVDPGYLDTARGDGVLGTLAGLPYVAGVSTDELSGERRLLVEYADPALLTGRDAGRTLWRTLLRDHPDVTDVVVRTARDTALGAPWQRHLTYVRLVDDPPRGSGPSVTAAEDRHRPLLADWLARALLHAAHDQGRSVDRDAVAAEAEALLDTPSRFSLLVLEEGRPVGHATVIGSAHDEVTAEHQMVLVDVLVEPAADGPACRRALVAAVADAARDAGLPLIGHVVHAADGGDTVTETLCARGWAVDHRYWSAPVEGLAAAVAAAPAENPKGPHRT